MSKSYVFYINGMTCVSCSGSLESMLQKTYPTHLERFTVDITVPDPKMATIQLKDDERDFKTVWNEIAKLIDDMGFECEPFDEEQATNTPPSFIDKIKNILQAHWFLGAVGSISGIALLILSFFMGGIPLAIMIPIACISVLLTLALGARSYYDAAVKLFKSGTLTMDTLFAISTLSVLAVSIASLFVPWLPMMFEVGLLIYGFRHVGLAIEETIKEKISSATFQERTPKTARLVTDDGENEIDVHLIQPDDFIIINPGELIPLDGICEGESTLYNTIITGAVIPRRYQVGEKVLAGMRVAENAYPLKIKVTKNSKTSYLARLDEGIAQSLLEKAPLEVQTGAILTYFIPTIIALAVISGLIIGIFFPPALAIQCALSVLVSACPCTLGLIVPLSVKTGMHKAAEHGVQFKNAKILQLATQIDTVIIDLHGTLTTGIPAIKQCRVLNNSGLSENQLLSIACALEQKSLHPVGKAIYLYGKQKGAKEVPAIFGEQRHHAGEFGIINEEEYTIGSLSLMQAKGISTEALDEEQLNLDAGDGLVFVAHEQKIVGYFIITEPLRADAKQTIDLLMEQGMDVHLCTGADEPTATRCANFLGIKKVHSECVATSINANDKSKPAYIQELQSQGHKVCMVGDGANDAHALAVSDFGIAVASQDSDDVTQQEAGAIIQSGSLIPIVNAFVLSKQTVSTINQSLWMSLVYNLCSVLVSSGLLISIGFVLNPAIGAALMALQACIILLFVYQLKHQPLPHLQEETAQTEETLETESSSFQIINQHLPKNTPDVDAQYSTTESKSANLAFWNVAPNPINHSLDVCNKEPTHSHQSF